MSLLRGGGCRLMKELRISFRWILRWIDERGTRPYHRFKSNIKVMWPVYPRVGEFLQGNLFSFIGEHSSITQEFDGGPDKIVATDSHKMELTTTELQELEEWVVTK